MTPPDMTQWVVSLVQLSVVGLVGFFARNAFTKVETTLEQLGKKIDDLGASVSRADGDRRVADAKHDALAVRVDRLERELRDLSEGVAR